jgi:hypothetical protein
MMSSIDTNIASSDTFIQDIQSILKDIKYDQKKKCNEIREHFKNIASNPEDSYTNREQIAILIEIMNCYNKNIKEYQKNMEELSIITKNLIKYHNNNRNEPSKQSSRKSKGSSLLLFDNCRSSQDNEDVHLPDDLPSQRPLLSLYEYFMQFIWGTTQPPSEILPIDTLSSNDNEPAVHFSDIFQDADANIQYTHSATVSPEHPPIANTISNKKPSKRRNTIQPIIKHIPHM